MRIRAQIRNGAGDDEIVLSTGDNRHSIAIAAKPSGHGLVVNGGELLFLAAAACYCNDIYREAAKQSIRVEHVEVEVSGDFAGEGCPAHDVSYAVRIRAAGDHAAIRDLVQHTDMVAEVHKTLRAAIPIVLGRVEIVSSTEEPGLK